jgi:hypothetical protein
MAPSRKPLARMSPEARARALNVEFACLHPYRDHRQERSQIATVCAKCPCVRGLHAAPSVDVEPIAAVGMRRRAIPVTCR